MSSDVASQGGQELDPTMILQVPKRDMTRSQSKRTELVWPPQDSNSNCSFPSDVVSSAGDVAKSHVEVSKLLRDEHGIGPSETVSIPYRR